VTRALACAGLALALALAGCVSLTPAQQRAADDVRAMADETARAYGVPRIALLVGEHVEGAGGSYRRGLFTISPAALTSARRDSIVAHELAHYLLGHDRPLSGTLRMDWQREQEQREMAANVKAVEILVRVRRMREEQALSLIYDHLLSFNRLLEEKGSVIPWGHRPPCDEIRDLLTRFPAHQPWTDGLECSPAPARVAAAPPAPSDPLLGGRDAVSSGLIVPPYFTDRAPAPGSVLRASDVGSLPRAFRAFDRSRDWQVTLFVGVRPSGGPARVVSRWYDEQGVERRAVTRVVEPPSEAGAWLGHSHTVPMWELRPYPGRWTAKVWVDEAPVGEHVFDLPR
jgi:hypothetical protein